MTVYNTFPRVVSGYNIAQVLSGSSEVYLNNPVTYTINYAPGEVLCLSIRRYFGLVSLFENMSIKITIDNVIMFNDYMWKFLIGYAEYNLHNLFSTNDVQDTRRCSTSFFLKMPYEFSFVLYLSSTSATHMGLSVALQYRYGG